MIDQSRLLCMYSPVNGVASYQLIITYETDNRFIHVRDYLLSDEEYREVLINRSRLKYFAQRETERTTNEEIINAHERATGHSKSLSLSPALRIVMD